MNKFPADFLWGTATAAAQVEGGWNEGGRTPSIWDVASKDKIRDKSDNHVADDHFHRYKEDVRLMKAIGVNSYRFSISWSRVVPEEGKSLEDYGLNPDGTGVFRWDDGEEIPSSVLYVHQKDEHLHKAIAHVLGLPYIDF